MNGSIGLMYVEYLTKEDDMIGMLLRYVRSIDDIMALNELNRKYRVDIDEQDNQATLLPLFDKSRH